MTGVASTRSWYDQCYATHGLAAQRRYPNEELLRFLGSYYFSLDADQRRRVSILEVGCGSGANLWMIAREGFDAHGLDLSVEALKLCRAMLQHWGADAKLVPGSMTDMPYGDGSFDVVVDVFSSYCLREAEFARYLDQVARVLKRGGRYFSYVPSKNADAFEDFAPSTKLDTSTLDGIHRPTSPYHGNLYPFRFTASADYAAALQERGFAVLYNERIGRTYRNGSEYFEFVSIAAEKS